MATLGASGTVGTRFERSKASQRLLPSGHPERSEATAWLPLSQGNLFRHGSSFASCGSLVFHRQLPLFQTPGSSPPRFPLPPVSEPQ